MRDHETSGQPSGRASDRCALDRAVAHEDLDGSSWRRNLYIHASGKLSTMQRGLGEMDGAVDR